MKTPVLLTCLALVAASAHAQNATEPKTIPARCVAVSEGEIKQLFDRWNASLKTGNPETVVRDNYANGSVLLPTVEDGPYTDDSDKIAYFKLFLKKVPTGRIVKRAEIGIDCNTAFDTGLYDFTFKDGTVVHARYTFTYRFSPKQGWLITSHHSSATPAE